MTNKNWKTEDKEILPDFIICGAMKSGTSTVHSILDNHPDVFIPEREVHFFDMDNILQHPDFNVFSGKKWYSQNMEKFPEKLWEWYKAFFKDAKKNQTVGEDSTTYLASEKAFERISMQNKKIKIIVMLRQPTSRAYSHYWHKARTGRAMFTFEESLLYNPYELLNRSLYKKQLQDLLKYINKKNVKIIIFEDFLKDKENYLKEICDFIGVDFSKLPKESINLHTNKGRYHLSHKLGLFKNRLFRKAGNKRYNYNLPVIPKNSKSKFSYHFMRAVNLAHRIINPLIYAKTPKINPETKKFLDEYFKHELDGINEIIGKDVMSVWFD